VRFVARAHRAATNYIRRMAEPTRLLKRAASATRSSKRVQLADGVDWASLVRDVAALANSGGGVVVVPAGDLDEEELYEQLAAHVEPDFEGFEGHAISRGGEPATALVVEPVTTPLAFTQAGRPVGGPAFARGDLYFRHGGRSGPATGADVRDFIRRALDATRQQWIANIRQVMHAPDRAEVAIVETAERDEEGRPTLIRLTTDPHAPLYGQVDPDRSHPYRQKEVINELNKRLDGARSVNAFDILSVRRVHVVSEETRPEFVHVPKFGSPQYSDAFVDWLVEQDARDPSFFEDAKARYIATRRRG
jgi:hypothetical protein